MSIIFSLLAAAATAGRESIITVRSDERRQLSPSDGTAMPVPNDELFSPAGTDNGEPVIQDSFFSSSSSYFCFFPKLMDGFMCLHSFSSFPTTGHEKNRCLAGRIMTPY